MKKNQELQKGQLEDFPVELIEIMLKRQEEQGNPRDCGVFQREPIESKEDGGFDWDKTPEGHLNWEIAIRGGNFDAILNHPANIKIPVFSVIPKLKNASYEFKLIETDDGFKLYAIGNKLELDKEFKVIGELIGYYSKDYKVYLHKTHVDYLDNSYVFEFSLIRN